MRLILIGPDCCGKSTLAKKLSKQLNVPIIKGIRGDFDQINRQKEPCIFDRIPNIDERIYTNSKITDKDIEPLKDNCIVLYIETPLSVLKERFEIRGDEEVNLDDIQRVKENYEKWLFMENRINLMMITYDYTKKDIDRIIEAFNKYGK